MSSGHNLSVLISQLSDLLRGPYRPSQYERIIIPFTVLRRFDCVLEATKADVVRAYQKNPSSPDADFNKIAGQSFHNRSLFDMSKLKADPNNITKNLLDYLNGFSENVRIIFERFEFEQEIAGLQKHSLLYPMVAKFADVNLHPQNIDNIGMGHLFENLIKQFNEMSNDTSGDHFTPREVIQLMTELILLPDLEQIRKKDYITVLDPTCGTGGMLFESRRYVREKGLNTPIFVFGQDFNPRSYAIAAADVLISESGESHIGFGDTLTEDQFPNHTFDYFIANPPFGVDWKRQQPIVQEEHKTLGFNGRFGAGLPRVNDGSLLFLQHMISKFKPVEQGGSRLAVVFNGSPMFNGDAGSGESEIRRWIIENDALEAIIALPEKMFFNTGIATFIWVITNRKPDHRRGKIQLIDAREQYQDIRKGLGEKKRELSVANIASIVGEYMGFTESATSKILANTAFGEMSVTVERPLRLTYQMTDARKSAFLADNPTFAQAVDIIDAQIGREPIPNWNEVEGLIDVLLKQNGIKWKKSDLKSFRNTFTDTDENAMPVISSERVDKPEEYARLWGWFNEGDIDVRYEPNTDLRDTEKVPLVAGGDVEALSQFMEENVYPHVADAWVQAGSIKIGYTININRLFYKYTPPRELAEIDADIEKLNAQINAMTKDLFRNLPSGIVKKGGTSLARTKHFAVIDNGDETISVSANGGMIDFSESEFHEFLELMTQVLPIFEIA